MLDHALDRSEETISRAIPGELFQCLKPPVRLFEIFNLPTLYDVPADFFIGKLSRRRKSKSALFAPNPISNGCCSSGSFQLFSLSMLLLVGGTITKGGCSSVSWSPVVAAFNNCRCASATFCRLSRRPRRYLTMKADLNEVFYSLYN